MRNGTSFIWNKIARKIGWIKTEAYDSKLKLKKTICVDENGDVVTKLETSEPFDVAPKAFISK